MKNILVYYILLFAPLGLIIWLNNVEIINATAFVLLLFLYLSIYRTYLDGYRLAMKNIIPKKDIWKMIIPGRRFQYFKELYLK